MSLSRWGYAAIKTYYDKHQGVPKIYSILKPKLRPLSRRTRHRRQLGLEEFVDDSPDSPLTALMVPGFQVDWHRAIGLFTATTASSGCLWEAI